MIKKLSKKIRPSGNIFCLHDTRGDVRTLSLMVNELTDKVNELIDEMNKTGGKNHGHKV